MSEHPKWLRQAADQIREEGHTGWGNTCEQAAEAFEALEANHDGYRAALNKLSQAMGNPALDFSHTSIAEALVDEAIRRLSPQPDAPPCEPTSTLCPRCQNDVIGHWKGGGDCRMRGTPPAPAAQPPAGRTDFQQQEDIRWLEHLFEHYDGERIEWRKRVDAEFSESYEREWLRYRSEAEALRAGIDALKRLQSPATEGQR